MYPLTGLGLNEPTWLAGAEAAIAGVNKRGGINGHPVKLDQCDDANDANKATACARSFVSKKVIAVAGGVTLYGSLVTPILAAAGIPQIGLLPIVPAEYNSPLVFPLDTSGLGTVGGGLYALRKTGVKTVFIVANAAGAAGNAALTFAEHDAASAGLKLVGTAVIPLSATSYSQYAEAAIRSKAGAVFSYLPPAALTSFLQAASQLNATFKVGTDGESSPSDYANEGSLASDAVYSSSYPPVTGSTTAFPALATFNSDMNALLATGNKNAADDLRTSFVERSWLSIVVTAQLASQLTKPTAAGMVHLLRTQKDIKTGLIPPWTPSIKGPKDYTQISNAEMYLIQRQGSGEKLIQSAPVDIMKILFPNG